MPDEREELPSAGRVPDLDGAVEAAVASCVPSGLIRHAGDAAECPRKVSSSRPVAASQIRATPSPLPVASRLPSALNATASTSPAEAP